MSPQLTFSSMVSAVAMAAFALSMASGPSAAKTLDGPASERWGAAVGAQIAGANAR